jgi:peptidoglycan/LPS O-acetylase OafA/YrhL
MFPFFVGVLIYRYRPQMRLNSLASLAILLGLAAMLLAAWPDYMFVSAAYVLVLFPMVVFAGSALKASSQISTVCTFAGALSYPVYILQGPMLRVGEEILRHVHVSGWSLIAFGVVEGAVVMLVSWLGLKLFDEPIQRMLKGRFADPSPLPLGQRP